MAAKRPVRYACTVRLVRDRKFGVWIKPLRVRWSRIMSAFFVGVFGRREVLEAIDGLMICSTSHRQRGIRLLLLVAESVLACVLLCFLRAFFVVVTVCLFLHFMVYSVETVTEAFWAFLILIFLILLFRFSFLPRVFLLLFCGKLWRLFFIYFIYFYITIIINQCKSWSLCGFMRQVLFSVWLDSIGVSL